MKAARGVSCMERRSGQRTSTGFETDIIYDNKRYTGTIENISASGANVLTGPIDDDINFPSYEPVELHFKSPEGKVIILQCTIMWSSKIPPDNVRYRIGMELVGKPWDKISFFLK